MHNIIIKENCSRISDKSYLVAKQLIYDVGQSTSKVCMKGRDKEDANTFEE